MKISAGKLTEFLTFKELVNVVSDSGFEKKEYKPILTTRAEKKRSTGKETEQAKEIVNTYSLTFLLRYNPIIKENHIVTYYDADYTISFMDVNRIDGSIELILNRKDK